MAKRTLSLAPRRGRPRKFIVPSRPITLTLPEQVIEALGRIDGDLGRAVVRLAQPELAKRAHAPAELAAFGRTAVIVVHPSRTLEQQKGVTLVHLPDGRALISFDQSITIGGLELMINDALEAARLTSVDRAVFEAIGNILRTARRSPGTALLQRNIIVVESRRRSKNRRSA
ncbi:MAG: hypothetical protein DMF84_11240 [Acidobacteria bacterium]|nr:MAG: hypothetical protein DMF84_11240 [Acidobacteriota bacterium]